MEHSALNYIRVDSSCGFCPICNKNSRLGFASIRLRTSLSPKTNTIMKFQVILATLASLTVAALAIPVDNISERVTLRGDEIKSLVRAIRAPGVPEVLAPDQSISCNISYSLSMSNDSFSLVSFGTYAEHFSIGASAPFTATLTTLDLSHCSFSP